MNLIMKNLNCEAFYLQNELYVAPDLSKSINKMSQQFFKITFIILNSFQTKYLTVLNYYVFTTMYLYSERF